MPGKVMTQRLGSHLGSKPLPRHKELYSLGKEHIGWESCKDVVISARIGTWRRLWGHGKKPKEGPGQTSLAMRGKRDTA